MSDGVLVVLSPFQWSQKDESLNAFDFHKILEDAGTQVVPLERPGDFLDEIRIIVKDEREPGETGQMAVMRQKASIAVIEEGGVHPGNGPGVMPGGQTFFQETEHFFRLITRFSADPDPQRNTAPNEDKGLVEEVFPLLRVKVPAFAGIGARKKYSLNAGQYPVQVSRQTAAVNGTVLLERGYEVNDETARRLC